MPSMKTTPTGFTAYSVPRRNSGTLGEIFSRYLLMAISGAAVTSLYWPRCTAA